MATAKKKAPAKKAPKKSDPKPPKSSMKDKAKIAGAAAKSKMSKETSAATRDKMAKQPSAVQDKRMTARADAYKKSGASYLGKGISTYDDLMYSPKARSQRNDLSGSGRAKFDDYGYVSFTGGRTSQRAKDQAKRKKK